MTGEGREKLEGVKKEKREAQQAKTDKEEIIEATSCLCMTFC